MLLGVWGSSDTDVYVASVDGGPQQGVVYHWDGGGSWTAIDTGMISPTRIWGSSATDVFVASFGAVGHFDGSDWSVQSMCGQPVILADVRGTAASDIHVVGTVAFISHYDGSSWTEPRDHPLIAATPTRRIGEYNGVALADGKSFAVWCGNTLPDACDLSSQQTMFESSDWPADVVDLPTRPTEIVLEPVRPNPTHRATTVAYGLPRAETADLSLAGAQGRRIATLVHGVQPAGRRVVSWDGEGAAGGVLSAGVYFLRLSAGGDVRTLKVAVIR